MALRPIRRGLEVLTVFPGTHAEETRLEAGDVIVTWRGRPVFERGCESFFGLEDDATVPVGVERDGRILDFELGSGILVP